MRDPDNSLRHNMFCMRGRDKTQLFYVPACIEPKIFVTCRHLESKALIVGIGEFRRMLPAYS